MRMWKRVLLIALAISSGFLMALGFNTLDWMVHSEHRGTIIVDSRVIEVSLLPPSTWYFVFPNKVGMPFWDAYFFGGILPLSFGSMFIGVIVGVLIGRAHARRQTRKTT